MKRVVSVVLALALAAPLAAAEKWYDWYNKGVTAVRNKQYDAGADLLQKTIAEMPQETAAARAKNEIITYVPHFWLGIARFNQGDVEAALREWKTSKDQGVVQNTPYWAQLLDWEARANSQKQRNSETAAADSRKAADAALSRALAGQMDALAAGGDRSDNYRAAQRKLQEALDTFNKAGTNVNSYHRAAEVAGQAKDMFASAADDARKQKAARPPAVAKQQPAPINKPAQPQPQPVVVQQIVAQPVAPQPQPVEPPKVAAAPPKPAETPVPVESEALVAARLAVQQYRRRLIELRAPVKDAQTLEQRLAGAPDPNTIKNVIDEVTKREHDLEAKHAAVVAPPLPTPPVSASESRALLESAYRAYANGDLEQAEDMLSRLVGGNANANAFLLRGCTRYTRAMLTRGNLDDATADFRAALRLNRSLRLDKNAFSPKLIAFFDQIRNGS